MNKDQELREAHLRIKFLEGVIKEQKAPTAEEFGNDNHRSVCLIPKDVWVAFKSACPKLGLTATKAYRIAIDSVIQLAK